MPVFWIILTWCHSLISVIVWWILFPKTASSVDPSTEGVPRDHFQLLCGAAVCFVEFSRGSYQQNGSAIESIISCLFLFHQLINVVELMLSQPNQAISSKFELFFYWNIFPPSWLFTDGDGNSSKNLLRKLVLGAHFCRVACFTEMPRFTKPLCKACFSAVK